MSPKTTGSRARSRGSTLASVTDPFYLEVEQSDGRLTIKYRREKARSRLEAILDAVSSFPWPPEL